MNGSYVPPNLDAGSVVGSVAASAAIMSAADSKLIDDAYDAAGCWKLKQPSPQAKQKEEERQRLITIITTAVASIAMVTAVVAMYVEASVIAYVAFAFPLVTGPLTIQQHYKLSKMSTFKQQVNQTRVLVNELGIENNRLVLQHNALEKQVQQLHQVEQELDSLARNSGKDVDELRRLATEYGEIQTEMTKINTTLQMQKFLTAVLTSDANGNFELDSPREIDLLVMRLKSIGGIEFQEETLRDSIANSDSKSLSTIYQVASGTLEPEHDHSGMQIEMT